MKLNLSTVTTALMLLLALTGCAPAANVGPVATATTDAAATPDSAAKAALDAESAADVKAGEDARSAAIKAATDGIAEETAAQQQGWTPTGSGTYTRMDPTPCGEGPIRCAFVDVYSTHVCDAGIYVDARQMIGTMSVGVTNGITSGLKAGEVARVKLYAGDGEQVTVTKAHCLT